MHSGLLHIRCILEMANSLFFHSVVTSSQNFSFFGISYKLPFVHRLLHLSPWCICAFAHIIHYLRLVCWCFILWLQDKPALSACLWSARKFSMLYSLCLMRFRFQSCSAHSRLCTKFFFAEWLQDMLLLFLITSWISSALVVMPKLLLRR